MQKSNKKKKSKTNIIKITSTPIRKSPLKYTSGDKTINITGSSMWHTTSVKIAQWVLKGEREKLFVVKVTHILPWGIEKRDGEKIKCYEKKKKFRI